jgi:hypothetical protein
MSATHVTFRRFVLGSALFCICAALWFMPANSAGVEAQEPARPASPAQPDMKDGKVKELLKERLAVLRKLSAQIQADYVTGKVSFDRVQQATRALLDAELEQCETDKERIAVLDKIVSLAKEYRMNAQHRYQSGNAPSSDVLMATAGLLEAEIVLERAKSKVPAPK